MDPNSQRMMMGAAGGAATIEFVATAQTQNANAQTTITISKPSGVQQGDLLIAFCAADGSTTYTGDTGWTEIVDQNASPYIRIAYLVAGASEPSSYTFTASSRRLSGVIAAFRNASYDTVGAISITVSASVQTAPAITLSSSGSALLAFFAKGGNSGGWTWSNPTSGLVSTASDSDATQPSWILYRQLNLSSGSTGTRSATSSSGGSADFGCVLVGIKPA